MLDLPVFSEIGNKYPLFILFMLFFSSSFSFLFFLSFDLLLFFDERRKYPKENPLGHETWPQTVPSDANGLGTVDSEKLLKLVEFFAAKGHPPLIILNHGTTFKVRRRREKGKGKREKRKGRGERRRNMRSKC